MKFNQFSILALSLGCFFQSQAQNLIPNPSFELVNICKKYAEPCSPKGWRTTTLKLPKYNDNRDQPANLGSRSLNLLLIDKARKFDRKFIQCELLCPIEAGKNYQFSFYTKSKSPIGQELHVLLSNKMYLAITNKQMQGRKKFLTIPLPQLKYENEWEKVSFEFVANKDATHLLIGNLLSDEDTPIIDLAPKKKKLLAKKYEPQTRVEYAIDQVELIALDSSHVDSCNLASRLEYIFTDIIRHDLEQAFPKKKSSNEAIRVKSNINAEVIENPTPLPKILSKTINILEGVEFASNTVRLTPESYINLNVIKNALIDFPKIRIKIVGHTDNVGPEQNNITLSRARAKSIYDFLVGEGIQPSRMSYDGLGETKPIATNDNKIGRQKNRRVEIEVLD